MARSRNVGVLIFDEVEILDFAGPYEVFSLAAETARPSPFAVYTVGITHSPAVARGKLTVTPSCSIKDCPQADILIIPGGRGTRPLLADDALIGWIEDQSRKVEWLLSVCTGALLLAKAGLLRNQRATTHHTAFDELRSISPTTSVVEDERCVESSGRIITSGGISAGIDSSLHLLAKLLGDEARQAVAAQMEYPDRERREGATT